MLKYLYSKVFHKNFLSNTINQKDLSQFDYLLLIPSYVSNDIRSQIINIAKFYLFNKTPYLINEKNKCHTRLDKHILYYLNNQSKVININTNLSKYNINPNVDPFSNWYWHIVNDSLDFEHNHKLSYYQYAYRDFVHKLKLKKLKKVYLFGTGPSLDNYRKHDFSDGYKIVCNSTVKDKDFFDYIKPDIVVAADAIFHYSYLQYARRFRLDLSKRIIDNPDIKFICPLIFENFIRRFIPNENIIAIPGGKKKEIETDLINNFFLPNLGNILTLMLLPIACSLSKNIYLFGFDGKKPGDKLFWSHSTKHDYPELLEEIVHKEPAFIKHHFPTSGSNKYIKENLDQSFEKMLQKIEKKGFKITMMHPSYISPLSRRQNH